MSVFTEIEEEIECPSCDKEFMVRWDADVIDDQPVFCPFCGVRYEDDEPEELDDLTRFGPDAEYITTEDDD